MLRRLARGLGWAILGYPIGAVLCYGLILLLSSNHFDRSLEAVMTAAFAGGPLAAVIAFVAGAVRTPKSPAAPSS